MKIQNPGVEFPRPATPRTGAESAATPEAAAVATAASPRADRVQISEEGRSLASISEAQAPLSDQRVAELRSRILAGAYDSLSVVDTVARRLLDSGDL